jgi:hypothetical protein
MNDASGLSRAGCAARPGEHPTQAVLDALGKRRGPEEHVPPAA